LNNLSFNTVDGFIYGVDFRFLKRWENSNILSVSPDLHWAFSREKLMWRINANLRFNRVKQMQLYARAGSTSRDIASGGSISTFLNSITTLLFKENYLKLYDSKYFTLGYSSEIINGLRLDLNSGYERRYVLQNTTDFSLIKSSKIYSDNTPDNYYLSTGLDSAYFLRAMSHTEFMATVTYVPFRKYKINNGVKIPLDSDWPTFNFTWQHGINELSGTTGEYKHSDMLKIEAYKDYSFGAFSNFRWRVRAGGYLDNRSLPFFDFFHFNSQPLPVLLNNYSDAFMIPAFYSLSTNQLYGEVHLKYTSPYLFLKLLPGLSNTLMRENLSLSYLGSRFHRSYTEIGYSISEFLLFGEIGVYAGFDDLRYRSLGAKLVLRFN
jgi:opacity protein-like surface antigen